MTKANQGQPLDTKEVTKEEVNNAISNQEATVESPAETPAEGESDEIPQEIVNQMPEGLAEMLGLSRGPRPEPKPNLILGNDHPGIVGPLTTFPEVGLVINTFAQSIMRGEYPGVTLTPAQREIIAVFTSGVNRQGFCHDVHSVVAVTLLGGDEKIKEVMDEKFKALLKLAHFVAKAPNSYQLLEATEEARTAGWSEADIHFAMAVASSFCFFNTYTSAAGNLPATSVEAYEALGKPLAEKGYLR